MDARRRFVISLCLLVGFVLIGTIGYMIIEGVGPLRAAYVTVVTISTVGSEHFDPSDAERVFTMFLIMAGVGSVYYASVSLVTLLVSGELRSAREKLKVEKTDQRIEEPRHCLRLRPNGQPCGPSAPRRGRSLRRS